MKREAFLETIIKPFRLMVQQSTLHLLSVVIGQSLEFEVMTCVQIMHTVVHIYSQNPPIDLNGFRFIKWE